MNLLSPLATTIAVFVLIAGCGVLWWWRVRRRRGPPPLPREWSLAPRPVFSADERRVHRSLREALPHHVVLAKLPLVRFCQPVNPDEIGYWYELLGSIHVSFAVCSPNGRVLAAIDLDSERGTSRRVAQIKQSVLGVCRVRYLRCPVDHLPSVAELQLLVPQNGQPVRAPQPVPVPPPGAGVATSPAAGAESPARPPRGGRRELWQDSTLFQDSFFSPDVRDAGGRSGSGESLPRPGTRGGAPAAAPPSARWLGQIGARAAAVVRPGTAPSPPRAPDGTPGARPPVTTPAEPR